MRNTDLTKVNQWLQGIAPYLAAAEEYNKNNPHNNYPMVYDAAIKNGHWGVTLPAANGFSHSANDCPTLYNDRLYATAWAMKIEALVKESSEVYLAWCQSLGYLLGSITSNRTGVPYIRHDMMSMASRPKYQLFVPAIESGIGYEHIVCNEVVPYYLSMTQAVSRRNRLLEGFLHTDLPEKREKKFRKILVDGAFQETFLFASHEKYRDDNAARLHTAFAMAYTYCDLPRLRNTFLFYMSVLSGELVPTMAEIEKHEKSLLKFLSDVPYTEQIVEVVPWLTRTYVPKNVVSARVVRKNIENQGRTSKVSEKKTIEEKPENIVTHADLERLMVAWGCKRRVKEA